MSNIGLIKTLITIWMKIYGHMDKIYHQLQKKHHLTYVEKPAINLPVVTLLQMGSFAEMP